VIATNVPVLRQAQNVRGAVTSEGGPRASGVVNPQLIDHLPNAGNLPKAIGRYGTAQMHVTRVNNLRGRCTMSYSISATNVFQCISRFTATSRIGDKVVRFGEDVWTALHALAIHLEHLPGNSLQRRQVLIKAFEGFGPIGRRVALEEVQLVVTELAALRCEIAKSEQDVPTGADGESSDGQPVAAAATPGR